MWMGKKCLLGIVQKGKARVLSTKRYMKKLRLIFSYSLCGVYSSTAWFLHFHKATIALLPLTLLLLRSFLFSLRFLHFPSIYPSRRVYFFGLQSCVVERLEKKNKKERWRRRSSVSQWKYIVWRGIRPRVYPVHTHTLHFLAGLITLTWNYRWLRRRNVQKNE